jgi:hypothetical protein
MQMIDVLTQMGGLQSMAWDLGVSESEAAAGAQALLPAILGGFKKQAQAQPAGLEGLGGLLGQLGGGGLLDVSGAGGGLGDLLGGLLGGNAAGVPSQAGAGGLGSMLDLNNDGNALDDILRMGGTLLR